LNTKQKIFLIGILLFIVAGLVSAISVIGRQARLVDVLILFFTGFAGGAFLISFIRARSK
jgi:hypothetical protein